MGDLGIPLVISRAGHGRMVAARRALRPAPGRPSLARRAPGHCLGSEMPKSRSWGGCVGGLGIPLAKSELVSTCRILGWTDGAYLGNSGVGRAARFERETSKPFFVKEDGMESSGGTWRGRDESKRQRAESQRIVAARPLCRLQYPVAYLSRLQRILPAARWELYFKAANAARPPRGLGQRRVPLGAMRPLLRVGKRTAGVRVASSPDSDLEAFSHNPAHGSFAPLAFQPSAMTNCANQRFLSY